MLLSLNAEIETYKPHKSLQVDVKLFHKSNNVITKQLRWVFIMISTKYH